MSGNPDQPPVVPGKTQETYYPPPPPGGPPHADQQQQPIYEASNSDLPPAYNTGAQQQAPPEKAPLPQQTAAGEQSFPPPPPGPPPSQQQPPYAPSRTDTTEANAFYKDSDIYEGTPPIPGPRPTGAGTGVATGAAGVGAGAGAGAGAAGAIPSYDPAHPHFAPPPGQQQQYNQQQYNQPPAGSTHPAGSPAQGHAQDGSHRSWGSLLTEMGHKAAAPINALANKLGSQSFLPTSIDKESEKAAQILRSFCKEGISSRFFNLHLRFSLFLAPVTRVYTPTFITPSLGLET